MALPLLTALGECRQAIRAALKEGTAAGQDIVEELDRMNQVGSPRRSEELSVSPRAQMWSSPIAKWTQGGSREPTGLDFHRPFRESRPGYARAVHPMGSGLGGRDSEDRHLLDRRRGSEEQSGAGRGSNGGSSRPGAD